MLSKDKHGHSETSLDSLSPLPISLQDLCLLEVINDLESYSVDLIASLPHWLCYRLLNNLPVLDLCRLDNTIVARGVNIGEVWRNRLKNEQQQKSIRRFSRPHTVINPRSAIIESFFEMNLYQSNTDNECSLRIARLKADMESVFRNLKREFLIKLTENREKHLLKIASDVLSRSSNVKVVAHKLISVRGDLLLQDLGSSGQSIWYIQVNSLATSASSSHSINIPAPLLFLYDEDVQLTPHRLIPIHERGDPIELFSLLTNICKLRPSSVNLDVDMLSQKNSI